MNSLNIYTKALVVIIVPKYKLHQVKFEVNHMVMNT